MNDQVVVTEEPTYVVVQSSGETVTVPDRIVEVVSVGTQGPPGADGHIPQVGTTASSATPTINVDAYDQYDVTALAVDATFAAPTGTPVNGQELIVRIKDNGTAHLLAFNSAFRFSADLAPPTTTVVSKTIYVKFKYNLADVKWDCLAWLSNF